MNTAGTGRRPKLLRARNVAAIDIDELIDAVGSVPGGLERELRSLLRDILDALLALAYTNADLRQQAGSQSYELQLCRAQGQLQLLLHSAPSIWDAVPDMVDGEYRWVKDYLGQEYAISLPDQCPFPLEKILEDPYDRLVAGGSFG